MADRQAASQQSDAWKDDPGRQAREECGKGDVVRPVVV